MDHKISKFKDEVQQIILDLEEGTESAFSIIQVENQRGETLWFITSHKAEHELILEKIKAYENNARMEGGNVTHEIIWFSELRNKLTKAGQHLMADN